MRLYILPGYLLCLSFVPCLAYAIVFPCSTVTCLMDSIDDANNETSFPGADTINLAAGTYTPSSGFSSITSKITIRGAGANTTIIKGHPDIDFTFFYVSPAGNLTLDKVSIRDGSSGNDGTGIINDGTVTILNAIIDNNHSDKNIGAIYNGGTIIIKNSTISDNSAFDVGGFYSTGKATIVNSLFSGNDADEAGAIANSGLMTVINSTITENTSSNSAGGVGNWNNGTLTIFNSTITNNSTFSGGGGIGNDDFSGAILKLQNTILALNIDEDVMRGSAPNCIGTVTSLGNNIIGDTTGCTITLRSTDLTGDPGLGEYRDNGTPGNGHYPLLARSRAVDAGNNAVCFSDPRHNTDQIGNPRVDGNGDGRNRRDIGAIEFGSTPAFCNGLAVTILGVVGNDDLTGTDCADVISALEGNDTVNSMRGNDTICAGPGDDIVKGGKGSDFVKGGKGSDTLNGELDNDTLLGEHGDDTLNGGDGFDICVGGPYITADTLLNCEGQ